jgi:energy-coupling factor transporter ATP-binding protein EcfA2
MKKLDSQSKYLEQEKLAPTHPDYSFSNVDLMLLVGKIGSGKTKNLLKHVLLT